MRLAVDTQGTGPDLVLLHGWSLHSEVWGDFTHRLARTHRVHRIDLPGHGHSPWLDGVSSLDAALDALAQDAPPCAIWLGWSLGGLLAARLAERQPQRVSALLLLGCNPCFVQRPDWPWGMVPETFAGFRDEVRRDRSAGLRRFAVLLGQGQEGARPMTTLRRTLAQRPPACPAALEAGLDWLETQDLRAFLTHTPIPVRLVGGTHDALVPAEAGAALVAGSSVSWTALAGAGHLPFLSHPEATRAALLDALEPHP